MIQAKIVADSLCPRGNRLTTLEVIMPRYILAEFNTHRMFSRNSASSRAIRFETMVQSIKDNPFIPYAWQKDHSGMQGNEYITDKKHINIFVAEWLSTRDDVIKRAKGLNSGITAARNTVIEILPNTGVTKQLCNRLLEPFMYHKVLVSATEWENFFELRCPSYKLPRAASLDMRFKSWKDVIKHDGEITSSNPNHVDRIAGAKFLEKFSTLDRLKQNDGQADIHMMFLAEAIYDAMNESIPKLLNEGEWHLPYGDDFNIEEMANHAPNELSGITMMKLSIVRCARISYHVAGKKQVIDYEADLKLYDRLANSGHWSPFEHVAKVMTNKEYSYYCISTPTKKDYEVNEGIVKAGNDSEDNEGWCKNFRGFIQQRELIE